MRWPVNIAYGVCCLLVLMAALMHVLAGYAGDKTWLLVAAQLVVKGRQLDVDVIEVNPPLVVWLYAVAAWMAQRVPALKDFMWLGLMGLVTVGFSVRLCAALMAKHPMFAVGTQDRRLVAGFLLVLFVAFTGASYFFDREHILLVCTFPYFLRWMPSLARQAFPPDVRLAVGALAALGFCIKPYTVIIFAVLQLLVMVRERSPAILVSLENAVIYAACMAYLVCVWHFTPAYIHDIMPMAVATYWAFRSPRDGHFLCAGCGADGGHRTGGFPKALPYAVPPRSVLHHGHGGRVFSLCAGQ